MRGLPLLVAVLAAAPLGAAEPLFAAPEDPWTLSFYGLARQGSADDNAEWLVFGTPVCVQVLGEVWVRLEVLAADEADTLQLVVPFVGAGEARLGQPVEFHGVQGDPCPDFTVRGLAVQGGALFRVTARGAAL